jgi:Tfp pilus assembly protein PilZ
MHKRRDVRRFPRSAIGVKFLVDGYLVALGEVADLSLSGAGVVTDEGFRAGDDVELRLEVEEEQRSILQAPVRFVWCNPVNGHQARCGVRWTVPSSSDRESLRAFIDDHCEGL